VPVVEQFCRTLDGCERFALSFPAERPGVLLATEIRRRPAGAPGWPASRTAARRTTRAGCCPGRGRRAPQHPVWSSPGSRKPAFAAASDLLKVAKALLVWGGGTSSASSLVRRPASGGSCPSECPSERSAHRFCVRILPLNRWSKRARTADLLHAIWRQHVHPRPYPQVTVPASTPRSTGIRTRCCTSVLYTHHDGQPDSPRPSRPQLGWS
jgi:hypothetical protein